VRTIGGLWAIETVSLRVFNAYGPGQNLPPSHAPVIPNFIRQAVGGGTLVVHSDGSQTRDYVYVEDVVRAMLAASTAPSIDNMIINVGSGTETSVRDLARFSSELSDRSVEIIYNPRSDAGVSRMCADIRLAGEKLHYIPRVKLVDGLRMTLERDPLFEKRQVGDT
jgi:UDP-glucose 4-epimerase